MIINSETCSLKRKLYRPYRTCCSLTKKTDIRLVFFSCLPVTPVLRHGDCCDTLNSWLLTLSTPVVTRFFAHVLNFCSIYILDNLWQLFSLYSYLQVSLRFLCNIFIGYLRQLSERCFRSESFKCSIRLLGIALLGQKRVCYFQMWVFQPLKYWMWYRI